MAIFSDLPNEIVSEVWGNILEPKDVESFALVSKHIYATGRPFVEEHNKLKREFSFFELESQYCASKPTFLLKKILYHPRVGLYTAHLSLTRFLDSWGNQSIVLVAGDPEWARNSHVPYPETIMALFIRTIRRSSFVPSEDLPQWINAVKRGDEDPILALLFMHLPNLNTVTLTDGVLCGKLLEKTLQRIANAKKARFLTHLVTVNIVLSSYGDMLDFKWLRIFAALPSVQSMHFRRVIERRTDHEINKTQHFMPDTYNIMEMTFTDSSLHPRVLTQLLESVNGLKRFTYVENDGTRRIFHQFRRFSRFSQFWPSSIRAGLLINAKHSLEYLKILAPEKQEDELLGSLCGFTALKEVETDVHLLCCELQVIRGWGSRLPASIEKLCLHTRDKMDDGKMAKLVEQIALAKPKLPNLKVLKIGPDSRMGSMQGYRSFVKPLMEQCRNVGIELTFIANQRKNTLWWSMG